LEQYFLGKSPEGTGNIFHYTLEHKHPPPEYYLKRLQAFENWASDSSCILRRNGDTAAGVHLVDEIRRLLRQLFQMASLHCPSPDLDNNNVNNGSQVPSPAYEILSIYHGLMHSTAFLNTTSNTTNT
jgi:hypothetical protein